MKKVLFLVFLALSVRSHSQDVKTILSQKTDPDNVIHIYDSNYHWTWDTLMYSWLVEYRVIDYVYNDGNKVLSYTKQDLIENSWQPSTKYSYSYDANNNRINSLIEKWNGVEWENYQQYFHTYDEGNYETSSTIKYWVEGEWEYYEKRTYAYDSHQNLIQHIRQDWDSIDWVNDYQFLYEFDENDHKISEIWQFWDDAQWGNYSKDIYTYDASYNLINDLSFDWNGTDWITNINYTYTYDAANLCTNELVQIWLSGPWRNWLLVSRIYDANQDNSLELHQRWVEESWVDDYQYLKSYDLSHNCIDKLWQQWKDVNWSNYYRSRFSYDEYNWMTGYSHINYDNTGNYCVEGDSGHYYSSRVVGFKEIPLSMISIRVFPNPATDHIIFDYHLANKGFVSIEIFNQTGTLVECLVCRDQDQGRHQEIWKPHGISPGIYTYRLRTGGAISTGKFTIVKS